MVRRKSHVCRRTWPQYNSTILFSPRKQVVKGCEATKSLGSFNSSLRLLLRHLGMRLVPCSRMGSSHEDRTRYPTSAQKHLQIRLAINPTPSVRIKLVLRNHPPAPL